MAVAVRAGERRLVIVIGVVVFVDTMFYAAIAPLLPSLAGTLHLSKLSAGVLTASYPVGTLVGALPGGVLAARAGPKFTVCAGLALLAGSTFAFGFLNEVVALDAARFVEGVGGACSWAGGLAWIVEQAPASRRGALIGAALGAAIAGALFGPVIGTIAGAIGRRLAFSVVVILALLLIVQAQRLPSPDAGVPQALRRLPGALRNPAVLAGMWLVMLPAVASGLVNVLGPLRLHRLGATAAGIGATFLAATAIEAALSPAIGRLSDRRGRVIPLRFGLAGAIVALLCLPLPTDPLVLALVVAVTIMALGAFWAPAMAMLADAAEARGLDQAMAAALMNLAWAGGQIVGAGGGGAVAKASGDALPVILAAALCGATLLMLAPRRSLGLREPIRQRR
jgi:MFS family permease